MSEDKKLRFLPFNALNEFMLDDYRQEVIKIVLVSLDKLTVDQKQSMNRAIKRSVVVPGFRNSALAPLPVKIKGVIETFQKNARFTAEMIQDWYCLNSELAAKVFELLKERGWELLPIETDRSKLPGFLITWPKSDSFEMLYDAYRVKYPDDGVADNDIGLMIVWLSVRLPYEMVDNVDSPSDMGESAE
jgi:hypothetical protein